MDRLCCIDMGRLTVSCNEGLTRDEIQDIIYYKYNIIPNEYFLVHNGTKLDSESPVMGLVHIFPRILGGKGGFGSMLRAIGAQIEKTTNREACRDLSGRRLRDINEEQRLKSWIAQQADREKEAAERKKKKLESLCREPKHEFKDDNYEQQRTELTENVHNSVEEGFKKVESLKRPSSSKVKSVPRKKKLLIDEDLSSSGDEDDADTLPSSSSTTVSLQTKLHGNGSTSSSN
ncbi:replication stress response regulator SDE2 [Nilaparvata lugens]|uniref:replication stress response regulator SDE2 n=1 Tax=Nilaparvata lugens TaxID=108931 RepID=UPI00193E6BD6|nr:replication stress response regulator SDE2 [Nilaparvata lugens]